MIKDEQRNEVLCLCNCFQDSFSSFPERNSMLSVSVYIDSANQIECKGVVDGCALTAPEEDEEQVKVDAE